MKEDAAARAIDELAGLVGPRVDSYEIFFTTESGLCVEARCGGVESLKVRSGSGVGLRTIAGSRLGFGFSGDLGRDALSEMAGRTVAGSLEADPDEHLSFPAPAAPGADAGRLGLVDPAYAAAGEQEMIDGAFEIESAARECDGRIRDVRKASYSRSVRTTRVVNSAGLDATSMATYYTASVMAVAEEGGESQTGWEMDLSHERGSLDLRAIGEGAARNALRMLGAGPMETAVCGAVIENTVVCELLEALAPSLLADNVEKGRSMLAGRLGEQVASGALSVWDDGTMPGGWASSEFDAEGVPAQRTRVLDRGVLRGYLYDTYWAARAGAASTGNAVRGGFRGMPAPGITNLYMEPGEVDLEGLISGASSGIFITEVMGIHTVNAVNGDFSVGAAGLRIEGGKKGAAVRGMVISGNLLELFTRVEACGADLRFVGRIGAPSIYVGSIEVSGS